MYDSRRSDSDDDGGDGKREASFRKRGLTEL